MHKPVIGIVGLGFVGGAVKKWFTNQGHKVVTYDIVKECTGKDSLNEADYIFICVPTPYKYGKCETKIVESTFEWLPKNKVIVIKSTIPPGTTEKMQKQYEGDVIFNPEFLDASKAEYDFEFPERQIIGLGKVGIDPEKIWELERILPKAHHLFRMNSTEAECVKYMGNTFFALKNVFANMWYDYCEKMGIDYGKVREAVGADYRIGHVHLNAFHKGGRGAGGSCLPKDLGAAIYFFDEKMVDNEILKVAKQKNDKRLEQSKKTDFLGMYNL
jgi:UDPglucose 6-dehydrogenase